MVERHGYDRHTVRDYACDVFRVLYVCMCSCV